LLFSLLILMTKILTAMRMYIFALAIVCLISVAYGQKPTLITDPKKQQPMLVGKCSCSNLKKGSFKEWFTKEYREYTVDTKTLDLLKGQWKDIRIVMVLGTWCSDSRREVPRFYKILDYVGFKKKNLKVICVDREKKAGDLDLSSYNIQYVPTMIIYRGKGEMGRIVENPRESLEKDLYKFVGLAE
jgi:hypothetical protein